MQEDVGLMIPGQELRSHMPQSTKPMLQPLKPVCSGTWVIQLESPHAATKIQHSQTNKVNNVFNEKKMIRWSGSEFLSSLFQLQV